MNNKYRHKKRGTVYRIIAEAHIQIATGLYDEDRVVIYQGEDGQLHVRKKEEFHDGRFEQLKPIDEMRDGPKEKDLVIEYLAFDGSSQMAGLYGVSNVCFLNEEQNKTHYIHWLTQKNACLDKVKDGEPIFVLLGRDRQAPEAIRAWADARDAAEGGPSGKTQDARAIAEQMATYAGVETPAQAVNNPTLLELIEKAKGHRMSEGEIYDQRRSFARGMCPFSHNYEKWCEEVDKLLPPRPKSK